MRKKITLVGQCPICSRFVLVVSDGYLRRHSASKDEPKKYCEIRKPVSSTVRQLTSEELDRMADGHSWNKS